MIFPAIEILAKSSSGKAYLVWFDDYSCDRWVPISQLRGDTDNYIVGYKGKLVLSDFIGKKICEDISTKKEEPAAAVGQVNLVPANKIYRKLAAKYHPDTGGDPAVMVDIQSLWNTVKDCIKASKGTN
jgi:hypothetical protein